MPQNIVELGFSDDIMREKGPIINALTEVYEATMKLDKIRINVANSEGLVALRQGYVDSGKAIEELGQKVEKYNKERARAIKAESDALIAQQKLQQAQEKTAQQEAATAAQIAKRTAEEAKAEQQKLRLAQAQEKINAANEKVNNIPFTHNLDKDGLIIEPGKSNTSGTAVNSNDLAYAELTNAASTGKATGNRVKEETIDTQELIKAKQSLSKAQSELNVQIQGYKLQTAQANQAAKQEAMEALGMTGAYDKLSIEYKRAQLSAKDLAATYGENDSRAKEAAASANHLSEKLKLIDASVGQFQRNVGNYTGAISILENALGTIKIKMDEMERSGQKDSEMYIKLQQEANLMYALTNQQAKGFASVTMEIRANERALQSLRAAGLEDTEAFRQLQQATADAHREFNKFQQNQKLLESNAPTLTAMTTAAKGLAGMYGVGAGAAMLFADGNEEVQRKLNSLVAIMTIMQGLESANELLVKKNAIATIARTTVQKLWNYVLTGSTTGIKANTVALEVESAAITENAATLEANTVAEGEMAAGTVAVTEATGGLSIAMAVLRGAIIATGIGALIVLLPTVANAMSLFSSKTDAAAKANKDLADAIKGVNDAIKGEVSAVQDSNDVNRKNLEIQLSNAEALGDSQEKIFAIKKKIAEHDKQASKEAIQAAQDASQRAGENGGDGIAISPKNAILAKVELTTALQDLTDAQRRYQKAVKKGDEDLIKSHKEEVENLQAQVNTKQALYDRQESSLNQKRDAEAQDVQLSLEQSKFSADEQRKIFLEGANISVDIIKTKNDSILNNEKSTYTERLAALKSNLAAEKTLIQAQKNDVLNSPSSSGADRTIAIKKAGAEMQKATIANQNAIDKLNEDYAKRIFSANQKYSESDLQEWSEISKKKTDNIQLSLEDRIHAQIDYEDAQTKLADLNRTQDLQRYGKTDSDRAAAMEKDKAVKAEIETIEHDHQLALAKIQTDGTEARKKIALSDIENQFKRETSKGENSTIYKEIQQYEALRKEFEAGKISAEKYQEQLKKINNDAAMVNLQSKRRNLTDKKERLIKNGDDTTDVDSQIAQNDFDIQKQSNSNTEDDLDKKTAKAQKSQEKIFGYTHAMVDMTTGLMDAAFDRQMQQLQKIDEQQQKNYDREKSRIENSTMDAISKQNRMRVLDQQRAIEKDQQEKKERKLAMDKAKFDKDAAIAKIILSTAEAIAVDTISAPWKIPIDAATGAAQLAVAIAQPLPHYAKGTDNHPGGLAVVGEVGRELVTEPGGKQYFTPAISSMVDLPKGTSVMTHEETMHWLMHRAMNSTINLAAKMNDSEGLRNEIKDLKKAMNNQTKRLERALGEKKVVVTQTFDEQAFVRKIKHYL
jgi:hypothetical protein